MDAKWKITVLATAALTLACSGKPKSGDAPLNDALRGDLARAAAPTSDLAASQFRPDRPVSNIELGQAPRLSRTSSAAVKRRPVHRATPAPQPQVEAVAAVAPEPAEPVITAPEPAPEPTAGPRPMPNPVAYPSGSGRAPGGEGAGAVIGTVIGVILRGGSIGDGDHCEIRPRGSGPILINQRMPLPMPMGGGGMTRGPRGIW